MISRMGKQFSMPEMVKIFSQENRYQLMKDVAILACEAMADIGQIPKSAYEEIKEHAQYDVERIEEIEEETRHNTIAFVISLCESLSPEASRYITLGLCSADLSDMVQSLQMRQAGELLQGRLDELRRVLVNLATKYKYTLMMGRTHGTYAEPTTFGLKMVVWIKEIDRSLDRLAHARKMINVGKLNGAVGTFSSIDPHVETFVCRRLGLHPAIATTQILQRDRAAEYMSTLAIISSSIEKFATEIRNLQSSDVREVAENMEQGELGSLSMPHKQRPYDSEIVSGLSRIIRANALAAMEDIPIWHEQDSSHYAVERIIIPNSCILLDYMIFQFKNIMEGLHIYPDIMQHNIDRSLGLVFSQHVLLALMEKGLSRDVAYEMVMKHANTAWRQQVDFQFLLLEDPAITKYLSRQEIMKLFDYSCFIKNVEYIYQRAGI